MFHPKRIIGGLVSVVLLATAAAASDSKVRGLVTDVNGKGIADARIVLVDAGRGREYKLKTNKKGEFYQRGVLPSKYNMTVSHESYTQHILEDVVVQAGLERELEITLKSKEERQAELRQERIDKGDTYLAGYDAFVEGDYAAAVAKAEETIRNKPDDPRGYDMKAKALIRLRRYAEAIPLLEKELAMEGFAEDAKSVLAGANYNVGVLASNEDKIEEALVAWERALELGFEEPALRGTIGRAYLQVQKYAQSRTHLNAYLATVPAPTDAEEIRQILSAIQELGDK